VGHAGIEAGTGLQLEWVAGTLMLDFKTWTQSGQIWFM